MVLRSVDGQELKSSSVPPSRQHPVASGNRPMTTAGGAASMNDNRSAIDADDLWRRGYRQVRVFHHHHHYHVLVKPKASHGGGSRLRPKACASSPSIFNMSHWSPPAPFPNQHQSRTQSTATCLICCGSLPASSSSSGICPPCENAVIASTDLQDSSPPTSTGTKAETPACWVCMGLDPRDATGLCTTCEGAVAGPDLHMTQQHLPNEQLARRINFEGKSGGGSKIGAIRAPSPSRTAVVFPMRPRILW
ncbi:hypothetical protein FOL47_005697 [Perkinsus chesapeaki]|uniref:Uncharacterized protein n=1 Tax=Perkinsus chesapeaki TaxID=330153 RepID=A0A7J6LW28_PERCH|nr:hypothetical protein FOL47_005697 [Perkinsus chesapeaki]